MEYEFDARYLKGQFEVKRTAYVKDPDVACLAVLEDGHWSPITVNLKAYGLTPPEGHAYVPNYGEGAGIANELVRLGIAEWVEIVYFGPFNVEGVLMKLLIEEDSNA